MSDTVQETATEGASAIDAPPAATAPAATAPCAAPCESKREMKPCFGINFGWFMEDMIGDPDRMRQCYECADFDRCQRMASVRALAQLRFEIRRCAGYLGRAVNGASSMNPLG